MGRKRTGHRKVIQLPELSERQQGFHRACRQENPRQLRVLSEQTDFGYPIPARNTAAETLLAC